MVIIQLLGNLLKAILFFANIWAEKDKEKAEKKAAIGKELVDAAKETDKDKRASLLNRAIDNTNSL